MFYKGAMLPLCYLYVTSMLALKGIQTSRKSFILGLFHKPHVRSCDKRYLFLNKWRLSFNNRPLFLNNHPLLNNKRLVAEEIVPPWD